jgi:hypothetical protein
MNCELMLTYDIRHNPNPSPLHVSAPKYQVIELIYQWTYWNVLVSFKSDIISLSNLIVFLQFIDRCPEKTTDLPQVTDNLSRVVN